MGNGSAGFNPSFNTGAVTSFSGAGRTSAPAAGGDTGISLTGTGGGDVVAFTSNFGTSAAGSTPGNTNVAAIVMAVPSQDPASVIGFPGGLDALRNPPEGGFAV